jgi:flagellar hook-basal body complex protein FliE
VLGPELGTATYADDEETTMQMNSAPLQSRGVSADLFGGDVEAAAPGSASSSAMSFKDRMTSYVNEVNQLQNNADVASTNLALGDVRSLHAVMIAGEEASLALSTAIQVRNKVMDSYQEIMRMQV